MLGNLKEVEHLMDPPTYIIDKDTNAIKKIPFEYSPAEALVKESGDHMKKDYGKLPWHLFPYDAAEEITKVLEFGAKKYSARGWEAGMDWSRVYSALMRHMVSWFFRRGKDPDTGLSHLAHAGCCILFLIAYELRNVGNDDRP